MLPALATIALFAVIDLGPTLDDPAIWAEGARTLSLDRREEYSWRGFPVWDSRVLTSSDGKRLERVELSLYNRGDADEKTTIGEKELEAHLAELEKTFGEEKGAKVERTRLADGALKFRSIHSAGERTIEIVWGLSAEDENRKRAVEYLRASVIGAKSSKAPTKKSSVEKQSSLKANVVKDANGDVRIAGVPMVNQGEKGYCAVATAERVLRYYGIHVDEHELAQQAGTTSEGGTQTARMREVARRIGERNGLGYQDILAIAVTTADYYKEIERYNKAAKALDRKSLSPADFTRDHVFYSDEMIEAMEPEVLLASRRRDSRLRRFSAAVRQQVNAGVPVFWGVTLGLYREAIANPQSRGGHMRLIIGYNDRTNEILYTDSWGSGHELKRLAADEAFAMTHDAYILKLR